jgi:hypothetical protein
MNRPITVRVRRAKRGRLHAEVRRPSDLQVAVLVQVWVSTAPATVPSLAELVLLSQRDKAMLSHQDF